MKKKNELENESKGAVKADEAVSRSKQKRLDRKKAAEKKKKKDNVAKMTGIAVIVIVCGFIAALIASEIIKSVNTITPSSDFSAKLNDNGMIDAIKASDYVSLCDYKSIEVPESEVTYTDEEFEEVIDSALSAHQVISEDGEVKDGDTVSIDYVGAIDGVEFEGGNSEGNGYDLTIGSGSFIDDFEQQLIGYKPGEVATVDVTFPDDYQDADLAGKDAQFTVEIHGIYVNPEYDDDFICAYYSENASTVDEYEKYLKDTYYEEQLTEYVENYLIENSTVIKYPKSFLKNVKSTSMYEDEQSYEYMNQIYAQYYGQGYSSFEEYIGMTDEEYQQDVATRAEDTVKEDLVYQAILESEGVTVGDAEYEEQVVSSYGDEEYLNNALETYGRGYLMLDVVKDKAIEIAKGYVTVK